MFKSFTFSPIERKGNPSVSPPPIKPQFPQKQTRPLKRKFSAVSKDEDEDEDEDYYGLQQSKKN